MQINSVQMKSLTFAVLIFVVVNQVNGLDSFDISEKWPECKDVFEDIQSQGNCSSSWAISVATAIRDRRCIKSGIKDPISAYDLISCCHDCQLDGKNG
jgi:cathepsin B